MVCANLRGEHQPIIWPIFFQKLHENEEILGRGRQPSHRSPRSAICMGTVQIGCHSVLLFIHLLNIFKILKMYLFFSLLFIFINIISLVGSLGAKAKQMSEVSNKAWKTFPTSYSIEIQGGSTGTKCSFVPTFF